MAGSLMARVVTTSDKTVAPRTGPRSLDAQMEALIGASSDDNSGDAYDPETGEIASTEATVKNASPGADQRQGAPADNDQAASAKGTGAGEAVASSSAATPAPAPKPVEPEPEQRAPAKAASPAPSKPQVSAEERRKLLLDDLTRTGERAAAQGRAALNEFIDELNGDEQAARRYFTAMLDRVETEFGAGTVGHGWMGGLEAHASNRAR